MRIIGPNFRVVLRLRDGVVAEAARPVSYMKGWRVERVFALAARWGWKVEMSSAEGAQAGTLRRDCFTLGTNIGFPTKQQIALLADSVTLH
jgi:hypothetical protein